MEVLVRDTLIHLRLRLRLSRIVDEVIIVIIICKDGFWDTLLTQNLFERVFDLLEVLMLPLIVVGVAFRRFSD